MPMFLAHQMPVSGLPENSVLFLFDFMVLFLL